MAIEVHLDELLRARGMTAKQLCALVGITEANLSILRSGKARGVRFGRPPREMPGNFEEVMRLWEEGKISINAAAKLCGVPRTTLSSRLRSRCKKTAI